MWFPCKTFRHNPEQKQACFILLNNVLCSMNASLHSWSEIQKPISSNEVLNSFGGKYLKQLGIDENHPHGSNWRKVSTHSIDSYSLPETWWKLKLRQWNWIVFLSLKTKTIPVSVPKPFTFFFLFVLPAYKLEKCTSNSYFHLNLLTICCSWSIANCFEFYKIGSKESKWNYN